ATRLSDLQDCQAGSGSLPNTLRHPLLYFHQLFLKFLPNPARIEGAPDLDSQTRPSLVHANSGSALKLGGVGETIHESLESLFVSAVFQTACHGTGEAGQGGN